MQQSTVNRVVLIILLALVSGLFLWVLRPFLHPIFLAALFSSVSWPLYRRFLKLLGGRQGLASLATLLLILLFVMLPLSWIASIAVSQAVDIANNAKPWFQQQFAEPGALSRMLSTMPFFEQLEPYRANVLEYASQAISKLSTVGLDIFQSLTRSTIEWGISLVIMLYTMFFLLVDGRKFLYHLLYYLPLNDEDESRLLERFSSVTRATLKGTAVIGALQGAAAGIGLYFAGVPSALFWALAMMLLSVVPGVGAALVWVPAVIWLLVIGQTLPGILLALWCALVVGSLDNLLRPKLVGNDTQLHELMIFFSTLGGILTFGFTGFIIGPIIAALFQTLWELYGIEFRQWLPKTHWQVVDSGSVAARSEGGSGDESQSGLTPSGTRARAEARKSVDSPQQPLPPDTPSSG